MTIADLRKEYMLGGLRRADLAVSPIEQFRNWLEQAIAAPLLEPNAMTLATADKSGQPSARTVLLKGVDDRGFSFFTNYGSRKARELAENPRAALVVYWKELERQVCIAGDVARLSREEAEAYYQSRPRGSRLGAWASDQASVVPNRRVLEARLGEFEAKYQTDDIPLPPYWGGFLLSPSELQFWQGRSNRLHDRFRYSKQPDDSWLIDRLAP